MITGYGTGFSHSTRRGEIYLFIYVFFPKKLALYLQAQHILKEEDMNIWCAHEID